MVIGTSRCAHVLCCLFCWRVVRAHLQARCARLTLTYPVRPRCAALEQKLAAGSLRVCTVERDAAMHPAPAEYPLGQRSRRISRSRSTQPPLGAVRQPTLAYGNRHMSAPVRRYVDAPRPKSRAGSRLSLPAPDRWSEPPAVPGNPRPPGRLRRWSPSRSSPLAVVRQPMTGVMLRVFRRLIGRIPPDVDSPSGEPGGQPRVLALLADGQ
jgi:hypothetical protein